MTPTNDEAPSLRSRRRLWVSLGSGLLPLMALLLLACGSKSERAEKAGDSDVPPRDSVPDTGGIIPPGQRDEDADGYPAAEDCDDTNPSTHPGAPEVCNSGDDNCDGVVDEGNGAFLDEDDDGYGDRVLTACDPMEAGAAELGGDCDDHDPSIHPGSSDPECDRIDQNCDGAGTEAAQLADGSPWPTVQEAMDAASDEDTVRVCSGRHVEYLVAPVGVHFDLESYHGDPSTTWFDGESSGRILYLEENSVTVKNLQFLNGYVEYVGEPGEGDETGGAILALNSDLRLVGCLFRENQSDNGGAINMISYGGETDSVDQSLDVVDSDFEGNFATQRGGDINAGGDAYGTIWITVSGSSFSHSVADRQGGSIGLSGGLSIGVAIEESVYDSCLSGASGGCLYFESNLRDVELLPGPISVSNTSFYGCQADGNVDDHGGALSVNSAFGSVAAIPVVITRSTFEGNSASGDGGAVQFGGVSPIEVIVDDVLFDGNTSTDSGGAMVVDGSNLTTVSVSNTAFQLNSSQGMGGGIQVNRGDSVQLNLSDVVFEGNSSRGSGGAIHLKGDTTIALSILDTVFSLNSTLESGSAIASIHDSPATIRCERCTITGGQAGFEAGAVDIDDFVQFDSIDSDWGSLSTNNSPNDLVIPDYLYRNLQDHETFSCSPGAGCTILIP